MGKFRKTSAKREVPDLHSFFARSMSSKQHKGRFLTRGRASILNEFEGFCLEQEKRVRALMAEASDRVHLSRLERAAEAGDCDHMRERLDLHTQILAK